jgi:hypothetical protein
LLIHLRRNYAELRRVRHCADSGMIAGRKGQLDGDGFTRQREATENYAAQHGITVAHWFEEKGVCGENELDERPALQELISHCTPMAPALCLSRSWTGWHGSSPFKNLLAQTCRRAASN